MYVHAESVRASVRLRQRARIAELRSIATHIIAKKTSLATTTQDTTVKIASTTFVEPTPDPDINDTLTSPALNVSPTIRKAVTPEAVAVPIPKADWTFDTHATPMALSENNLRVIELHITRREVMEISAELNLAELNAARAATNNDGKMTSPALNPYPKKRKSVTPEAVAVPVIDLTTPPASSALLPSATRPKKKRTMHTKYSRPDYPASRCFRAKEYASNSLCRVFASKKTQRPMVNVTVNVDNTASAGSVSTSTSTTVSYSVPDTSSEDEWTV